MASFPSTCVSRLLVAQFDVGKERAPLRNEKKQGQEKGSGIVLGSLLILSTQTVIRLKLDVLKHPLSLKEERQRLKQHFLH